MRDLNENPCPVASERVGTDSATMLQIDHNLKALADDLMALLAADIGDKADSARIMLILRVVETLGLG